MQTSHQYEVNVEWKKGRVGEMSSPELEHTVLCATPPEFPKGVPGIWSPEHLITAAVNSCLLATFLAVAESSKLKFEHFECKAIGKLEKVEGKFLMTEILLEPTLVLCVEEDENKALRILEKSEKACLISNSIKSKIVMVPTIKASFMCV